jgi:hypothetical protein
MHTVNKGFARRYGGLLWHLLDRWRVAQQLVRAHGEGAEYQADLRGAAFLKEANTAGFYLGQDIALKVSQLLQKTVADGQNN